MYLIAITDATVVFVIFITQNPSSEVTASLWLAVKEQDTQIWVKNANVFAINIGL